ncbi:MAG: methyltransferase domain-containing protein [Nanoarchaeota archaeon]|nr:methyltransferase domain-containing protein [Nanoarchaeota archaeon]
MDKKKLNLGCGTKTMDGFINLDKINAPGVNVTHDLDDFPYPFGDDSLDYIITEHVLEHIGKYHETIKELVRILKPRGILEVVVPYTTFFCSEFHHRFFRFNSLHLHRKVTSLEKLELYKNLKTIKRKLEFDKKFPFWYNYIPEILFNLHPMVSQFYEKTFFRYLFPAATIRFILKKKI